MKFGRYGGRPPSAVPVRYLAWVSTNMRNPPPNVLRELQRRSEQAGTRDAVEAQAALSNKAFPVRKKPPRKGWRGVLDSMP